MWRLVDGRQAVPCFRPRSLSYDYCLVWSERAGKKEATTANPSIMYIGILAEPKVYKSLINTSQKQTSKL